MITTKGIGSANIVTQGLGRSTALIMNTSVSLDALIHGVLTKTTVFDSLITKLYNLKSVNADGLLKFEVSPTFTVSADSILHVTQTPGVSLDTLLTKLATTKTVNMDAYLRGAGLEVETTLDALLHVVKVFNISLDGFIYIIKTSSISLDALIYIHKTFSVDLDAYMIKNFSVTASMDGELIPFTTAYVKKEISNYIQRISPYRRNLMIPLPVIIRG